MLAIPTRVIATCFALVAFATSVVVGITTGNAFNTVILRATLAMLACFVVGYIVGWMLTYVMQAQIDAYKQANPLPSMDVDEDGEEIEEVGVEDRAGSNAAVEA